MQETRILVVEDDPETSETVRDVLCRAGYEVRTAFTGRDALAQLLDDAEPAAIVLDVRMPVMDGREFLSVARAYRRFTTIPVIVLTATEQQPDWIASADLFMRKPFRVDELVANVKTLIENGATRAAP